MDFAGRQIQGARELQEDYYAFEELPDGGLLLVLSDGVGGHNAGEVASETAALGFFDGFARATGSIPTRLQAGLQLANRRVGAAIDQDRQLDEMGATLLALHLDAKGLHWISVGDSPLFLFRSGQLVRLNQRHSAAATGDPSSNLILSAVTGGRIPFTDLRREPLLLGGGDLLLAASDGLLTLSEVEISLVLAAASPTKRLAETLLADVEAKARGNQDNATVALIRP